MKKLVLLDAGHGNNTPGKRSPEYFETKIREFEFNRMVVHEIGSELTQHNIPFRIINLETIDVSIGERVKRINRYAKENPGSFLISVHANASKVPDTGTGWEAFASFNASKNSMKLGAILYGEAERILGNKFAIRKGPEIVKRMNLQLLRDTNCPAILTENLFFDNKKDVEYMHSIKGRLSIVNIHVNSILKYQDL